MAAFDYLSDLILNAAHKLPWLEMAAILKT